MSHINLTINYAGMTLQIGKNEQGEDVTPLKPFADLFGFNWPRQHSKVSNSPFLKRFLGICVLPMYHAASQNREQTCILVSRAAAYLMSINPEQVRSQGNVDGADFLEAKLTEWADALHEFETYGVAFKTKRVQASVELQRWFKIRAMAKTPQEQAAINTVITQALNDLGVVVAKDPQQALL